MTWSHGYAPLVGMSNWIPSIHEFFSHQNQAMFAKFSNAHKLTIATVHSSS